MKTLYLALFLLSVFLLVCSIPPVQSELSLIDRLALHPDAWNLSYSGTDPRMIKCGEKNIKQELVIFLKSNRPTKTDPKILAIFGVSAVFSFIGWRRELYINKNA